MAKNANHDKGNRHVALVAMSGGGKSQLARNDVIPRRGIRALFWDVDQDHYATRFYEWVPFAKAVVAANKSGKPFRIAWSGDDSEETFQKFCHLAWSILDGDHDTWLICEEMADQDMGQKMPPYFKKLMVRGRKYGAILVITTQRCQEVPKAMITQPATRYYGQHVEQDAAYMERLTKIKAEEFERLEPLTFFKRSGTKGTQKIKTKWRRFKPNEKTRT